MLLVCGVGCRFRQRDFHFSEHQVGPYRQCATEIEYPDIEVAMEPALACNGRPRSMENPSDLEAWDMTLPEAVRMAVTHGEVIRVLGGSVVASPGGTQTTYDPALIESDPRTSVEAALSAFDAQLSSSIFWNKIDRGINQTFAGLFLPTAQQLDSAFQAEVTKATATGAKFSVRHHVNYSRSITLNPSLRWPSVYQLDYEAEYRQPLLQGAGVEFNRIAGPNATAGSAAGVLLARINTDISLADFEKGVTQLVSDVEEAYWNLYFAYRDLETKLAGRDSALVTWRNIAERLRIEVRGGTPENEAQLRSQYFTFQAAVEDAVGNLYMQEARLRYLLSLPPNGPRLIRPSTEPSTAKLIFDWPGVLSEAYGRRVELRRQQWQIKRRELELVAARNFIKPRLDTVALYRWRGIGDELLGKSGPTGFENAYQNLLGGDFQEWQLGLQLNIPIGFRREFTALRNAELQLARERALLREQEFRISHDLSSAIRELERAFQLTKTNLNRRVATYHEVQVLRARSETGFEQIDVLLQAERRLAEADVAYYRSVIDYALATKNVHREKGSLLEYDGITLTEGPWANAAYREAFERSRHFTGRPIDYGIFRPHPLSRGSYLQIQNTDNAETDGGLPAEVVTTPPSDATRSAPTNRLQRLPPPVSQPS